ncbi:MAG: hypothetical protein LBV17_06115 [Treponema sp.]|jgi:predicted AAA+ superfamily ATPase|nr:hypothetical protein [Treponema sp.]
MTYLHRQLENFINKTVKTRPIVYFSGMRQCGKSALVRNLSAGNKINYITFDDPVSGKGSGFYMKNQAVK